MSEERRSILTHPLPETCELAESAMSPTERIARFEALWSENKDRIHMPKPINYPINYKAGMKWARRHCDPDSARFAEQLVANTAYVSFGEFIANLERICTSFCTTISARADKPDITLILPFDTSKSNLWVSLLAWPWLRGVVTDISFSITGAYNVANAKGKPTICIVCDDCAYTGNQLMSYCTLRPSEVIYPAKPKEPSPRTLDWIKWNNEVTAKATELEHALKREIFAVALMIPYMSTHAQANIANHPFIMAPKDVKIFQLFRERVSIHEFNQGAIREFESTFQYHSNISAIYFDHKVADAVSTFNKIYLLAPVFGCGDLRASVCFIDGCCSQRMLPANFNTYDVHMNLEDTLGKLACPPTFYKKIVYVLDGVPLGQVCIQSMIEGRANRQASGRRSRRR